MESTLSQTPVLLAVINNVLGVTDLPKFLQFDETFTLGKASLMTSAASLPNRMASSIESTPNFTITESVSP